MLVEHTCFIVLITLFNCQIINIKKCLFQSDTATVRIDVIDVNDHNPVFDQQVYMFDAMAENKRNGLILGQVAAKDLDSSARISYSFVENVTYVAC